MSNDPNLKPSGTDKARRPRTVGMYARPDRPAISPVILIVAVLLVLLIIAAIVLFLLPR